MMNSKCYTLLTGSTGQIGRYLLRDLLLAQRPLAVLVRRQDGLSAKERVQALLQQWQELNGLRLPLPICLEGDTRQAGFGLSQRDAQWIKDNCDTLFHNAASVEFQSGGGETWQNNVTSARRTLEVCQQSKIEHLIFVSTAYVAGRRKDRVFEDELDCGQTFRNEYEHSKFEAERTIRQAGGSQTVTVLRPGIVVGDYTSGYTHAFHSFYQYVMFTWMLANAAEKDPRGRWKHDVRLTLSGGERRNLVCVDWVSAAMTSIAQDPSCRGGTFHVTPQRPATMSEIEQALQLYFKYDGVQFVGTGPIDRSKGSPEEQRFYEYLAGYSEYWDDDPIFDRSHTDAATPYLADPQVDLECMLRLIDYAVRARFGRTPRGGQVHDVRRNPAASPALH